ncbi:MAG: dephospho-CoA kinase [Clostridia bacterium]|nr:dephospho-CoA kinase [Clostridia bacterium]
MKVIGLTGPSGSGKGWVCRLISQFGIPCIDTDAVYHQLLAPPSPCLDELSSTFGINILRNDGSLDRAALASIVFSDEAKLKLLNEVTHKYILGKTDSILEKYRVQGCIAAIVDAPALFESGYDKKCDFVITVTAPREKRIDRIIKRDALTEEAARKRIDAQKPDEFYSSHANYTVTNNGCDTILEQELNDILRREGLIV